MCQHLKSMCRGDYQEKATEGENMAEGRAWGSGGKGSLQRGLKHVWRGRSEPSQMRAVVNSVKCPREVKQATTPQECSLTLTIRHPLEAAQGHKPACKGFRDWLGGKETGTERLPTSFS